MFNRTWIRLSNEGVPSSPYKLSQGDIVKLGNTVFVVSGLGSEKRIEETEKQSVDLGKTGSLCKVCYARTANGVFVPCGHNHTCYECARKCKACPMCRAAPKNVMRIFS